MTGLPADRGTHIGDLSKKDPDTGRGELCASMTSCGSFVCAEPVAVTPLALDTRTQPGPDAPGQARRAPLRAVAYEKDML